MQQKFPRHAYKNVLITNIELTTRKLLMGYQPRTLQNLVAQANAWCNNHE
jgi:hypothetical protein